MIVMCSSPLLILEFRTDASGRKSFTMGRNPLERGGISDGWIVGGNTKSKICGVGFCPFTATWTGLSTRDIGIFGYPHKRNLAENKKAIPRHKSVQPIVKSPDQWSAQEDRVAQPILEPSQKGSKTSSPRAISCQDGPKRRWNDLVCSSSQAAGKPFQYSRTSMAAHPEHEEHILLLLCAAEQDYHLVHAIRLGVNWTTCRTQPHRSYYHSTRTGRNGGRPNRMDALPPRISSHSR